MVRLIHLHPGSNLHNFTLDNFTKGWQNPGKSAEITDLFYIVRETPHEIAYRERNIAYLRETKKKIANAESYLFHGTQRACMIGEDPSQNVPCHNPECHICSILRCSWRLSTVSQHNMFGPGFYTSPTSSKADGYAKNSHIHSKKHAMLLGSVITGRKEILYHADRNKRPSPGFDSCEAATIAQGGSVNYTENIVYKEEAIIPGILVMYKRTGWTPSN